MQINSSIILNKLETNLTLWSKKKNETNATDRVLELEKIIISWFLSFLKKNEKIQFAIIDNAKKKYSTWCVFDTVIFIFTILD
jgi:hypothetical protein